MVGHLKVLTIMTGTLSVPYCVGVPDHGGTSVDSDHITVALLSERGIMITDSQIYDFTSVEKESTDTSFTMQAENESYTEYNKEVLL